MRRQRNMSQLKEQDKTPEKELKRETNNLPDAKFKALVVRMLNDLDENFKEEIGKYKRK